MTIQTLNDADPLTVVATLAPRIAATREATEQGRRVPPSLVNALRDAGLFRLCLPPRLGGPGTPFATFLRVVEAVAAVDGSVGWVLMIGGSNGFLAGYLPDDGAAEVYRDPRVVTAAALMPKGRAVPVAGGYRVSGRWPFASGIRHCGWVAGACVIEVEEAQREPAGTRSQMTMVFPIAEVEILDTWYSGGLRGTDSTDFVVHDAFVPTRRVALNGRLDAPDPVSRVPFGTWETPSVAAVGLGIARAAIDALVALAGTKVPTRRHALLREELLVQVQVAEAEAMLEAARLLFFGAASTLWETLTTTGDLPQQLDLRLKLASAYAVDTALKVVDHMHREGGSSSIWSGSQLDRCLRDIHVVSQHAGLGPQHYEAWGRVLLGLDPAPPVT